VQNQQLVLYTGNVQLLTLSALVSDHLVSTGSIESKSAVVAISSLFREQR